MQLLGLEPIIITSSTTVSAGEEDTASQAMELLTKVRQRPVAKHLMQHSHQCMVRPRSPKAQEPLAQGGITTWRRKPSHTARPSVHT